MSYQSEIKTSALKELRNLQAELRRRIQQHIDGLAEDPRPRSSEALKGNLRGLRRLRVGEYRVSYRVNDEARLITVTEVGHRKGIYRRIARKR